MKKKFLVLLLLIVSMTIAVNVNYSASNPSIKRILQNVEALATNPETGGSSNVVGKCKDTTDTCEKNCPGIRCTMKYKGTSEKDGPLEFVSGTCSKCGYVFN